MIRKLFAAFFLALFVLFVSPLLIAESIVLSFLRLPSIQNTIIPESFDKVTAVVSEQFAETAEDNTLFKERIRKALSRETYENVMRVGALVLFGEISAPGTNHSSVSLVPFKDALQKKVPEIVQKMPLCGQTEASMPSFRFCKSTKALSDQQLEHIVSDVIEKEIPPRLALVIPGNVIALSTGALPAAIVISTGALLLLISFCVWGSWSTVLRWIGISLLGLMGFIVLFIISLSHLNEFTPLFVDLSKAQWDLFSFLIDYPARRLIVWCVVMGVLGVGFISASFVPAFRHKKQTSS